MVGRRLIGLLGAGVIGLTLAPAATPASAVSLTASPAAARAAATASKATAAKKAKKAAATIRVATYNVMSSRVRRGSHSWYSRSTRVARTIMSRKPGIAALQELGPGRADGVAGHIKGHIRQTEHLVKVLRSMGGSNYRLVRAYSYNAPNTKHGTQGARILYDTSKFTLLSRCPEKTGSKNYNHSCSIELPRVGSAKMQRSAAYALFKVRATGKRFWVASAHLDDRHGSASTNARMNALRQRQAAAVVNKIASMNSAKYPVIFGGDINSWRNDRGNWAPHRTLTGKGFTNAIAAPIRINARYSTVNHFKRVQARSGRSTGAHLDVIMVKGAQAFLRWENVMKPVDGARCSDHNMVVADIKI